MGIFWERGMVVTSLDIRFLLSELLSSGKGGIVVIIDEVRLLIVRRGNYP